jgi:hypothetical protein
VSTILNEIGSSLNDYPISHLNYAENCSIDEYNGNLLTQEHVVTIKLLMVV